MIKCYSTYRNQQKKGKNKKKNNIKVQTLTAGSTHLLFSKYTCNFNKQ